MNSAKKIRTASVLSALVLTAPGLGFCQSWKAGRVARLPAASNIQVRAGIAWPMSGLTFRGKMDQILWDQGLSPVAPKPRPEEPRVAPSGTEALKQAAQFSQDLSKDLKNSSDVKAKQKSDEIFGMRPEAFEHQLSHVMAVVNDIPVERLRGKQEAAGYIKKTIADARLHRLVLSTKYMPYGPMRQEVALSVEMEAPLLQMEKLAARLEKSSGGKKEFVKKFYDGLSRLGKKWLKKARSISGSAAR